MYLLPTLEIKIRNFPKFKKQSISLFLPQDFQTHIGAATEKKGTAASLLVNFFLKISKTLGEKNKT